MEEYKKFLWSVGVIIGVSMIMVGVVYAHDHREELAFIDHLCHFHMDERAIREEADRAQKQKEDQEEGHRLIMRDLKSWSETEYRGERGTSESREQGTWGPPDRDR